MRINWKHTALAALLCISSCTTGGCGTNRAGGDLEGSDYAGYALEGGNMIDISDISTSGNDVQAASDTEQSTESSEETAAETEESTLNTTASSEQTAEASADEVYTDSEETVSTEEPAAATDDAPAVETVDPLNGLTAVARVEKWVNVRTEPSTQSGIVGKIYNNCAATIIDEVDGEDGSWYYMNSGNVTGYVKAEYFVIGEEAEALKDEIGLTYGRVIVENLRVRETPDLSTDDNIVTMYPMGTEVAVLSHDDDWALIETDAISTGYVHVSCIEMWTEFDVAITLEEEAQAAAEQAAAEEAARVAEEEYLALLAQQQAAATASAETAAPEEVPTETPEPTEPAPEETAAPAETPAPAETAPAETPAPTEPAVTETEATQAPTETQPVVTETDVNTALRNAIVAFALQFNGCPYVHAGRSLSQGTDCSGFTNLIYQNFGYNLDWTPAGQAQLGVRIDYHDVQPGDLLFYSNSQSYLGHVALYIGDGKIIHAANEQYGICIWDMNYREPLFGVSIIN